MKAIPYSIFIIILFTLVVSIMLKFTKVISGIPICNTVDFKTKTLELQLQNGNVFVKDFTVPVNSYFYISTNRGSYTLYSNFNCIDTNWWFDTATRRVLMQGVIHFEIK